MSNRDQPMEDVLLAFLRGELDAAQKNALQERLRNEPELREELLWLQAMAAEAFIDDFRKREGELFERHQQGMRAARAERVAATPKPSFGQRLGAWFTQRSLVLQGALAVLVVGQAIALSVILQAPSPQPAATQYRGAGDNCLTVSVRFRPGVTEQQMARWLNRYDASIHAGPDVRGSYRIAVPTADDLKGFLSDPRGQTITSARQLPPRCKTSGN